MCRGPWHAREARQPLFRYDCYFIFYPFQYYLLSMFGTLLALSFSWVTSVIFHLFGLLFLLFSYLLLLVHQSLEPCDFFLPRPERPVKVHGFLLGFVEALSNLIVFKGDTLQMFLNISQITTEFILLVLIFVLPFSCFWLQVLHHLPQFAVCPLVLLQYIRKFRFLWLNEHWVVIIPGMCCFQWILKASNFLLGTAFMPSFQLEHINTISSNVFSFLGVFVLQNSATRPFTFFSVCSRFI